MQVMILIKSSRDLSDIQNGSYNFNEVHKEYLATVIDEVELKQMLHLIWFMLFIILKIMIILLEVVMVIRQIA